MIHRGHGRTNKHTSRSLSRNTTPHSSKLAAGGAVLTLSLRATCSAATIAWRRRSMVRLLLLIGRVALHSPTGRCHFTRIDCRYRYRGIANAWCGLQSTTTKRKGQSSTFMQPIILTGRAQVVFKDLCMILVRVACYLGLPRTHGLPLARPVSRSQPLIGPDNRGLSLIQAREEQSGSCHPPQDPREIPRDVRQCDSRDRSSMCFPCLATWHSDRRFPGDHFRNR